MRVRKIFAYLALLAMVSATGMPGVWSGGTKAKNVPVATSSPRRGTWTLRQRIEAAPTESLREAVKIEPGEQQKVVQALEKQMGDKVVYDKQTGVLVADKVAGRESLFSIVLKLIKFNSEVRALRTYKLGSATAVDSHQVVAQLAPNVSEQEMNQVLSQTGKVVRKEIGNRYIIEVAPNKLSEDVAETLSKSGVVNYAEQNLVMVLPPRPEPAGISPGPMPSAPADAFPSDALFNLQWGLENRGTSGTQNADIHIKPVWRTTPGSDTVKIAIIDEGVDTDHPDLKPKIVRPYDATKDTASAEDTGDDDQRPNRWEGHGTACAGLAAAVTGNRIGIAGVAWNAKIIPIKVAKKTERGGSWITSGPEIATGIRQAVARGADVISLSWGATNGGWSSLDVRSAIETAITTGRDGKGTVVVAAAGNVALNSIDFPACLAGERANPSLPISHTCLDDGGRDIPALPIIVVGATNERDQLVTVENCSDPPGKKWGSNFGREITIVAPGINITTTDIRGAGGFGADDYITNFNGTSSATPQVAGVAALIISKHPDWNVRQVRDQIAGTADDLGTPGADDQYGFGRVNACRALEMTDCSGATADGRANEAWPFGTPSRFALLSRLIAFAH